MATTLEKRTWKTAMEDAEAFRAMFPPACYERWEIAGSVRRRRPMVGDVEHVVIPRMGEVETGDGLFKIMTPVNLLWHHLDALIRGGQASKHVYNCTRADGTTFVRQVWGDTYRGVDFNGFNHEIFTANADNWGAILLIRTGPAEFSKAAVDRFNATGTYRQAGGVLRHVETQEIVPVPDERTYFKLMGWTYVEPEKR